MANYFLFLFVCRREYRASAQPQGLAIAAECFMEQHLDCTSATKHFICLVMPNPTMTFARRFIEERHHRTSAQLNFLCFSICILLRRRRWRLWLAELTSCCSKVYEIKLDRWQAKEWRKGLVLILHIVSFSVPSRGENTSITAM